MTCALRGHAGILPKTFGDSPLFLLSFNIHSLHMSCACFMPGVVHDDKKRKAYRPLPQVDPWLKEAGKLTGDSNTEEGSMGSLRGAAWTAFLKEMMTKLASRTRAKVAGR